MRTPQGRKEFLLEGSLRNHYANRIHGKEMGSFLDDFNLHAIQLYQYGREAYLKGDKETQNRCERLNFIINSCRIPCSAYIGRGTDIAYSGPGVSIHYAAQVGDWCVLGKNVSLAAAPTVGDHVYFATGAQVIKSHCKIGSFSIIGANAVVTKDVPSFSVVTGIPGQVVTRISPDKNEKYLASYFATKHKNDPEFVEEVREKFLRYYQNETERQDNEAQ